MIFRPTKNNHSHYRPFRNAVYRASYISLLGITLLSGCTVLDRMKKTVMNYGSAATEPARAAEPAALSEGINLYEKGDFNGAIKRLSTSSEIWVADKGTQTKALKYMAFSYCVTSRQLLCKHQFEKALKLDPAFDLEPGEKKHPLWGPVFERAKKAR